MESGERGLKRLVVTADDFGRSSAVNQAIDDAHRRGILTCASLMVAGDAAADAVDRARALPSLKVGLHVVVVDGRPALPPGRIPDLVDASGRLPTRLVRAGLRFAFNRRARAQLADEIRAQFEAFAATGLALDHVNAHHHMHLHPTVLGLIVSIGRDFGMRAVRVPNEPPRHTWAMFGDDRARRLVGWLALSPCVALMRARLHRAGIEHNDYLFGLHDTGRMDASRLLAVLSALPDGVSEAFLHPATGTVREGEDAPPERGEDELAALLSRDAAGAVERAGASLICFADVAAPGHGAAAARRDAGRIA